jgi:hypothetical protein
LNAGHAMRVETGAREECSELARGVDTLRGSRR